MDIIIAARGALWVVGIPLAVLILLVLWDYVSDKVQEASWDYFHKDPPDKNKGP